MNIEEYDKDWLDLTKEYKELESVNRNYLELLENLDQLQQVCVNNIKHQRYRMGEMSLNLKKLKINELQADEKVKYDLIDNNILKRKAQLYEIEQTLPQKNSMYLKIILGNVNVSILNRNDKVRYKDDYEKFKLILNIIGLSMSFINLMFNYRALELIFIFLLVWYYCTLTIRESILKVNGSRIKGWWRAHHFISTVCAGVLLVWPQGDPWQKFRNQFMYFNAYISMIQFLQFTYQKGVLYRLKALGERHDMDITIEGFHSWMWRGLGFLLPFLYGGYFFQLFNSYKLYKLSYIEGATWQIPVLSILFFMLSVGNAVTTSYTVKQKIKERSKDIYRLRSVSWAMNLRQQISGNKTEKLIETKHENNDNTTKAGKLTKTTSASSITATSTKND